MKHEHMSHMHAEHARHGERMHHESSMHSMHGDKMHGGYKNEVEKPAVPAFGHISAEENIGYGMRDWKGEADPIAYGQASSEGCKADEKRIHSQFKDYHWD